MKNKAILLINKNLLLILILITGIVFRFINLDKPEGMWEDEIFSYLEAKDPGLWLKSLHAPLYYVILHFWVKLFGEADFIIRMLSVIFGVLTVYVVYLAGKELDSKKTGLLAGFLTAISSFLIYYSQEVRIYSLLAFFAALTALFLIKIYKNPSKLNVIGLALANLGIIYTHIIGFVFVFFEALVFLIYFLFKKRENIKAFLASGILTAVLFAPFVYKVYFTLSSASSASGIYCQWWSQFNFSKLLFSFGDIFSPLIVNLINTPDTYSEMLLNSEGLDFSFLVMAVIPSLIGLTGLIYAVIRKNILSILLLTVCLGFVTVFTAASIMGKVVFITKYIIEIVPVFILITSYGLANIKNSFISKFLISLLITLNLLILIGFMPYSAPYMVRNQGNKIVTDILEEYKLNRQDIVVIIYGRKVYLEKYYDPGQVKLFDDITKLNFQEYISQEPLVLSDFKGDKNCKVRKFLISDSNDYIEKRIKSNFINHLEKGGRLVVVLNNGIIGAEEAYIKEIASSDDMYNQKPILALIFSKIANRTIDVCNKELKLVSEDKKHCWQVYVYEK